MSRVIWYFVAILPYFTNIDKFTIWQYNMQIPRNLALPRVKGAGGYLIWGRLNENYKYFTDLTSPQKLLNVFLLSKNRKKKLSLSVMLCQTAKPYKDTRIIDT